MTEIDARLDALRDESAESVVRTYLERWNAHDVEGMLALLGDGLVFRWGEDAMSAYREHLVRAVAWRLAADFEITAHELAPEGEHSVRAAVTSTTRAHQLLGLSPITQEIAFWVEEGIIASVTYPLPPDDEEVRAYEEYRDALAPVIAWTAEHRPEEVEELFTRRTVLNVWGETARERRRRARRQVVLLQDYRNATELADLTKDQLHSFKWRLDPDGHSTGTISLFYPHPETGETVWDNRRLGWRSLGELPRVLAAIIREDGADKGEWRH